MDKKQKEQHKTAKVIFGVQDEKGEMHYLYGDDFVAFSLNDVFEKLKKYEAEMERKN